jgi:hypothetical protein
MAIWSEISTSHDPVQIGTEFQSSIIFLFDFTLLDRICPECAIIAKTHVDLKRYRFRKKHATKKL